VRETDGDQEESNKLCPKCTPTHPIPANAGSPSGPGLAVDEIFDRHDADTEAIIAGHDLHTAEEPFGHDTLRGVDICPHGPGRMNCEHEDCIEWRNHGRAR